MRDEDMKEWESLRVGDRIRIIRLPSTFGQLSPTTTLVSEELRLYKKLIASRKQLTVTEIDKDGRPWIRCSFRQLSGRLDIHYLAVDDDSWVRVQTRRRK